KATANDIGADLDLSQLLEPSDQLDVDTGLRPRNSYGQSITPDWPASPVAEEASATPWHMMTRPLKVDAKVGTAASSAAARPGVPAFPQAARAPQAPVLFDGDLEIGLSAFCRGAGIDPRTITPEARGAALQLAGQLLRESVLGLMDLTHSRNEFRNRFRISAPPNDGPDSPLNFSGGVDEALVRLLTNLSLRAGSVEAIRDNFKELKAQ